MTIRFVHELVGAQVAPEPHTPTSLPSATTPPSLSDSETSRTLPPLSLLAPSSRGSWGSAPLGLVHVSRLEVAFSALPVRRHLSGRPVRMVLYLGRSGGPVVRTRKAVPRTTGGVAQARWEEDCELALGTGGDQARASVLQMELQAVGFLRSTTLSFTYIDLEEIPANTPLRHTIDFGFGTLTVELQLKRGANPLLGRLHHKPCS
eukprot:RCo029822